MLATLNDIADLSVLEKSENGYSSKVEDVMLLGRIRAKVEDPYLTVSRNTEVPPNVQVYVLDVIAIKDGSGVFGEKGRGAMYLTSGTVAFAADAAIQGIEGAFVYVWGGQYTFGSRRGSTRKMSLSHSLNGKGDNCFMWSKSRSGGWQLDVNAVNPLRRSMIREPMLEEALMQSVRQGEVIVNSLLTSRGRLQWNRNEGSGLALPTKGSIAYKQKTDPGYSYLENEGRSNWAENEGENGIQSKSARDGAAERVNPNRRVDTPATREERLEYEENRITGEAANQGVKKDAFNWNAERHGEEGIGFPEDDTYVAVKDAVLQYKDNLWKTLDEKLRESRDSVSFDFLDRIGRSWRNILEGDSRNLFPAARPGISAKRVKSMLFEIGEMVYGKYKERSRGMKTGAKYRDYANLDMNDERLGAHVVLLTLGIRNDDPRQTQYEYTKCARPIVNRLISAIGGRGTSSGLVSAAKLVVSEGESVGVLLGLGEYAKTRRSYIKTVGAAGYYHSLYEQSEEAALSGKALTEGVFRATQAKTNSGDLLEVQVGNETVYSTESYIGSQIECGSVLDVDTGEGKYYYNILDAARSVELYARLHHVEENEYTVPDGVVEEAITRMELKKGFALDETQKNAVKALSGGGFGCLTGVAGSGKSTVLSCLIDAVETAYPGMPVILAAPTGKAAKRMTETTGIAAKTMHSTFHLGGGEDTIPSSEDYSFLAFSGLDYVDRAKLDTNPDLAGGGRVFYIFDEVSMCGFDLMCRVMGAVSLTPGCKVLFVGDKEQLPPVQDYPVFAEVLSLAKRAYRLGESHRAAEGSLPTLNAYKILKGEGGSLETGKTFEVFGVEDDQISQVVQRKFLEGIAEYGVDGCRVVTPFKNSATGNQYGYSCSALNGKLVDLMSETGVCSTKDTDPKGGFVAAFRSGGVLQLVRANERVMNTENTEIPLAYADGSLTGETDNIVNGQEGRVVALVPAKGDRGYYLLVDMSDEYGEEPEDTLEDATSNSEVDPQSDEEWKIAAGLDALVDDSYLEWRTEEEQRQVDASSHRGKKYAAFRVSKAKSNSVSDGKGGYSELPAPLIVGGKVGNLEISYAETVHKMQGSEVKCIIVPLSSNCARMSSFINRALVYTAVTRASVKVVFVGSLTAMGAASREVPETKPCETLFGAMGWFLEQ